ncbi:MAG: extracellular solute-binding protein [Sedimentisphaerales bacterium]|nr:extracellular solute-binding protein [Sedimentisphaerales bacterium]
MQGKSEKNIKIVTKKQSNKAAKRQSTGFSLCLCVFAFLCLFLTITSCKKQDSSKKKVVLYCSVDMQFAEPIIERFEKQSGIDVLERFDEEATKTVGLVQRIRSEASNPVADVFWSGEIFYTIQLANEGLLAPYESETIKDWPELFKDKMNRWHGFGLRARVIAYNTNKVSAEESPKSLEDCLDSKWRGRIVMATPSFGTTGGDVASWFAHYGTEKAAEILKALKENGIRTVSGNSTAVRMVSTGQADICFTDTDDVYAAQRNGHPVAMNLLRQDGHGPLAIPNTAALIKNAPHPDQAKELLDFILSEELEILLAESDSHNSPIHPSLAEKYSKYAIKERLNIEYEKIADLLPASIESAKEILE